MLNMPIVIAPLAAFLIGLCVVPTVRRIALGVWVSGQSRPTEKTPRCPDRAGRRYRGLVGDLVGLGRQPAGLFLGSVGGERDTGWFLAALGLSSLSMLCLGLVDDRMGLRARYKLAGQVVAAVDPGGPGRSD